MKNKSIVGYGIGIVKTLLLWAVIGAGCVIAYRYAVSNSSPEVKQQASRAVKKVQQMAANVKKVIAEDPQMRQVLPKAEKALNKLKQKIVAQPNAPDKPAEKVETEKKELISSVKYSNDKKKQDLFDRQVAIVNDLL
jgi:hypothetical protein